MPRRTCTWVLRPATPEQPAAYCDRPIRKYTIDKDGSRRYETLCPEHKKKDAENDFSNLAAAIMRRDDA